MKKFIVKVLAFILIPSLLFVLFVTFLLPQILSMRSGASTMEQIKHSFKNVLLKDYTLLIVGNSRIYRGINPDMFSVKAFNFAHDNDTYNQIFYKLQYLEKHKKTYKYLILGIDYFQFSFNSDTRNYVYKNYLGSDYLKDYKDYKDEKKDLSFYIADSRQKFKELLGKKAAYIKDNGQYIKPGIATPQDTITRDSKKIPFQVNYFNRILKFCSDRNIRVFLVMPPTRVNELNSYSKDELSNFDKFFANYLNDNVILLNYSKNKNYLMKDYTDITHLNSAAADIFSKSLNKDIFH
jgi:hypothetical protein